MPEQNLPENLEELLAKHTQRRVFSGVFEGAAERLAAESGQLKDELKQRKKENAELIVLAAEFLKRAERDAKTGLLNVEGFKNFVNDLQREGFEGAVLLLDIDNFKKINDSYGHLIGDEVLKAVAEYLGMHTRPTDGIGRWGGEEFIVYFPEADEREIYLKFGKYDSEGKYIPGPSRIEMPFRSSKGHEFAVTFSGGIASLASKEDLDTAVHKADVMLYKVKNSGKNRLEMHETSKVI